MKIKLPPKKGEEKSPEMELKHLVVIGANGAGKTRFGSWIEENNYKNVHRISAQKSLSMPLSVRTSSMDMAKKDLLYGTHNDNEDWLKKAGRKNSRWKNNLNTSLLNDYEQLMVLLHTEEYEKAILYKDSGGGVPPTTNLDRIQRIWEKLLPDRKLKKGAGVIDVYVTGQEDKGYNASEMSDGERVIFYLIGEVLCVPKNSIIIIDEPEVHIHKSLISRLFDLIEAERRDCAFIYLTHDIDFAVSRYNAKKIWAKSYNNGLWDYEILEDEMPIPEPLCLEILGGRQPVIFIEGGDNSWDNEIYSQVYVDNTIKSVGSCNKVIQIVKALNDASGFHNIKAWGIVDLDRRTQEDIKNLVEKGIWVLDVAEQENIFLIKGVVRSVATYMHKDPNVVFSSVKENLINFFAQEKEKQVLLHFKDTIYKKLSQLAKQDASNIEETIKEMDASYSSIEKEKIANDIDCKFQQIINMSDYDGVLRVFNMKDALIPKSGVCDLVGIKNQNEYRQQVISLLKGNDATSEEIRAAIRAKVITSFT